LPSRFFVDAPLAAGDTVRLPADVAHHATKVLRLGSGEAVVLFNGRGGQYPATLRLDGASAMAQIDAFDPIERESPLALTLIQALVAADKLDWIVEKAVELGAQRIVVAPMQRCVVRLDAARAARRLRHWRDIARAACCQCGRNRVPAVDFCESFAAALAVTSDDQPRLMLMPGAAGRLPSVLAGRRATLMVGPEGGLSADEVLRAESAGFVAARLGPRILRTETAGLAALASLQTLSGDLAAPGR
jgi:16S rRNA (uracil1498-N3)-methyltransferase